MTRRVLITGASVAGTAMAFWMRRLGWEVVLLERAPQFRTSGQNIDVRGPGHDAVVRMGLLDAVKANNTTEQAWTFVTENNELVARFDKEAYGKNGPTAELEILRGDLARVLDEASDGVEHRFDDAIASVDDDGAGVDVRFESGGSERFDLVVAAEGIGSSTRKIVFADEARIEPFGLSSAYFSIPKGGNDGKDARWFNAPGGRSVFLRPDPHGTTRVVLSIQENLTDWDNLPREEQKRKVAERYADAGWETPRVLEGMKETDDFYFHTIALVKMDRFHKGRVALTGDAAWAVMGSGTTLALIGPYVLAGELARADDIARALVNYDKVMRPYVDQAHKIPSWGPKALQPATRFGIALQHAALRAVTAPGIRELTKRLASAGADLPDLPDYPELAHSA